jgi:hypothetical protein
MSLFRWALAGMIAVGLAATQAQAEPCGSPPYDKNAACTAAGQPFACCTAAGQGTCGNQFCLGAGNPVACCTGAATGTCTGPVDPGVVDPYCIDCSINGGCTLNKYGLGHPDNFDYRRPVGTIVLDHDSFPTGSYFVSRGLPNLAPGTGCGPEAAFVPIQGQAVIREHVSCTPTGFGPMCAGGVNAGKNCHLGVSATIAAQECPGSTCVEDGAGCPVELPRAISGGVTPAQDKTTWSNAARVDTGVRVILSSSSATLGGTSNPSDPQCLAGAIWLVNARGTRYLLSEARRTELGLPPGATYIQWRDAVDGGLYRHEDDSEFCCSSTTGQACNVSPNFFQEYPINLERSCATPGALRVYRLLQTNDWVFEAGRGSDFRTDPEHIVPGEVHGVCRNNRFQGCTSAAASTQCTAPGNPHACCGNGPGGTHTCGTECDIFGDICDLREAGLRQTIPLNLTSGFPDPTRCSTAIAVLRGTASEYCTINTKYAADAEGDPGAGCIVWNFGFRPRPDLDCNGVEDVIANGGPQNDQCPFLSEFDYFKDSDGDCALGRCRGDECECTDQNIDGRNTVSDIVEINVAIYTPSWKRDVCDGNNDLGCDVSDIVAANIELFSPDSSACRHLTSIKCGNNAVNTGEACDNGAVCQGGSLDGSACDASAANICTGGQCVRLGGDGCSRICRVEAGWTCTATPGLPSVCTRLPG